MEFLILFFLIVFFISQCKTQEKPEIESLSPSWVLSRVSATITIIGKNFDKTSKIIANSKEIETEFVNSTELKGNLDEDLTYLSLDEEENDIKIYVRNGDSSSDNKSEEFTLKIYHVPQCDNPTLLLSGDNVESRKDFNVLIFGSNNILINWKERSSENDDYSGKFIVSKDQGKSWTDPKDISGDLFVYENKFYRIDNGKIFRSNDEGESWEKIGEKPVLNSNSNEELLNYYLRWVGDSNLYCIYSTQTPSKVLSIYTYFSSDFGENWEYRGKFSKDISGYYDGEGATPCGVFLNNNNGIRLEYLSWSGRHQLGICFVSSDGGLNYKETYRAYSDYGIGYLLNDNTLVAIFREYYLGEIIGEYFEASPNLGLGDGYSTDLWEIFSINGSCCYSLTQMMPSLNIKMGERYFISIADKMTCSYDKGQNWSKPASFLSAYPDDSKILPFIEEDGRCYTIVLTPNNDIYFSKSVQ